MTPADIEALLSKALAEQSWLQAGLLIASCAASAAIAALCAWFVSYSREKGRNFATREDIAALVAQQRATTEAVEGVRAGISGDLWLAQQLWAERRTLLGRALADLLSIRHASERAGRALELAGRASPGALRDEFQRQLGEQEGVYRAARERLEQALAAAAIFARHAARASLETFFREIGDLDATVRTTYLAARAAAASRAFDALAAAGRAELGLVGDQRSGEQARREGEAAPLLRVASW